LKTGKPEWRLLARLLQHVVSEDIDVVVGPAQGEDAAVIRVRDGFLVIHSDPITTGAKRIGYLAIHIAANDIAVRGVKPKWFLPVVLIPENYTVEDVEEIFSDMGQALRELDGVIVGGHTEVTPGLSRPIISVTAAGYTTSRVILTRDARLGDIVYVIGRVGGEGSGIIAWDFEQLLVERGVDRSVIERAKNFIFDISVVRVALEIREYVSTMHDATEGGVLQALREIAVASNKAITVDLNNIRIDGAVETITRAVCLNPLRLLSSGCIVATVPQHYKRDFENTLEALGKPYSAIGAIREGSGEVYLFKGSQLVEVVTEDIVDEIYKLWT
jgi:hydrogenase expression/formation protein HypE